MASLDKSVNEYVFQTMLDQVVGTLQEINKNLRKLNETCEAMLDELREITANTAPVEPADLDDE